MPIGSWPGRVVRLYYWASVPPDEVIAGVQAAAASFERDQGAKAHSQAEHQGHLASALGQLGEEVEDRSEVGHGTVNYVGIRQRQ